MDQQGAVGSLDLKKDRSHAQTAPPASAARNQGQGGQETNGLGDSHAMNGALSNGVAAHEGHNGTPPTTNGQTKAADTALADPSGPPPLDQSWREQVTNKSFGKLLSRVSHQCFVDLHETLSKMNAVQDEVQRPQINGALQPAQDTSDASVKKKRLLMEFANNQRDRFIKTLVLADASRNQEDHARLIDVKVWQDRQHTSYNFAQEDVAFAKLRTMEYKLASPNIEAAMELLSTGKASRMPHLGYVPAKKASAKELLSTLHDMNVIIATRLSLDDELSPHMQDYSIADGRVTFRVPDEFEVDLSVGDDNPASQFFFLDLRLAFTPSTGSISDTLRSHLESRVNQALLDKGLPGCYDFLHNFVLTHKINLLRSQVSELTQTKWFDCVRAENLRRSLTVQYWTGKPGAKSWIEVGIGSGKVRGQRSRKVPSAALSVRWFRQGVEAKDEQIDDWGDVNLERCLSTVIEKHTSWLLLDLQTRLQKLAPAGSSMDVRIIGGDTSRKGLSCSLPSSQAPLEVNIDPVTGQYSISPPSGPTARAERYLNNDPNADTAMWVANTLCAVAQERVHKVAELLQWSPVPRLARQDNLQKFFGQSVRAHSTFLPSKAWGADWALAVTFTLAGENWWAVSLTDKLDDQGTASGRVIASARRVRQASGFTGLESLSQKAFLQVERSAVAEVAFGALSANLNELRVPHRFERRPTSQKDGSTHIPGVARAPVALFFEPARLLREPKSKHGSTWARDFARLTHHGMIESGSDRAGVRHDLRVALQSGKMKELRKHLTNFKDRNLIFNEEGAVALRILAPFGKSFAEQIRSRLQSIERLDRYVRALQKLGLPCTHVSLTRLSFTYSKEPELSATLLFPSEDGLPVRLKLHPSDINPHSRIKPLLETGLNEAGEHGVQAAGFILLLTLPLLQSFERIETNTKTRPAISVLPQSSTKFLLKFAAPLPPCTFDIRARLRKDGAKRVALWHIQLQRSGAPLPDAFAQALRQDLWQSSGAHWRGMGNGVTATALGIGAAMDQLDGMVRRFEGSAQQQPQPQPPEPGPASAKAAVEGQAGGAQPRPAKAAAVKMEQPDVIMLD